MATVELTDAEWEQIKPPDESELIDSDGEPMESPWHRAGMELLIQSLAHHWRDRDDFYVGGNMFLYFSAEQVRKRNFRGPDFFVVLGVPRRPVRRYWATWLEDGRYPDFILELTSPSTAVEDRTTKKVLYERTFRTREYVLHDPDTGRTDAWRLGPDGAYQPVGPDAQGRFWSETLQLALGPWEGTYSDVTEPSLFLRFFTADGRMVLVPAEEEHRRAEEEHRRAEAAEAELARLRALLEGRPPA